MKNITNCFSKLRYPKTDKGRRRYIESSLSGNITPWYIELIMVVILSPIILIVLVYASLKWFAVWLWPILKAFYFKYLS